MMTGDMTIRVVQRANGELVERPKTGHQSHQIIKSANEYGKLDTYHNLNGIWGKKLFHEGEWAIYEPGDGLLMGSSYRGEYNCVVIHSRIWEEKRVVHKEGGVFLRYHPNPELLREYFETETIELVCHTKIFPVTGVEICRTCGMKVPDGVIALWKLLNMDQMSEEKT